MVTENPREKLKCLLKRYIDGDLTGTDFEWNLMEFYDEAGDETVNCIAIDLVARIDVLDNKPIKPDKEYWDLLQRLLLILESGASIKTEKNGCGPRGNMLPLLVYSLLLLLLLIYC